MKKIIFAFLCLMPIFINAQFINVDSLVNILNTKKLTTDEQLRLYEDICQHYYASYSADKTMEYAEKGLKLAEVENKLKSSIFYEFIGYAHKDKMNYDTALVYYEKALELAIKAEDIKQQVSVYIDIGTLYGDKEMWDSAYEYFLKALPLSETLDDKAAYISILGNIGSTHRMLYNSEKAIFYFERMKEMAEQTNNLLHKRKAYYELGVIYKDKMEYRKSLEYIQSALNISRETNSKVYETMCLHALAQLYSYDEIKDFDKSIQYAKESLILSKEVANPLFLSASWTTLSTVYSQQGEYDEAINAAYKAMDCDSTNMKNMLGLYTILTDSYLGIGNTDSAASTFHKYSDLKDKYITKELQELMTNMEVKYETEKKETRIAILEEERKLYIGLGIAIVTALLLGLGFLFYYHHSRRRIAKQQIKQLEQEKKLIVARSALKAEQTEREIIARDLHDGVGAMLSVVKNNMDITKLHSIIENAGADYLDMAMDVLDKSITELRRVSHHIMPRILIEEGLVAALDDFCRSIPVAKFYCSEPDCRFNSEKELVIYRCAYELINNALRHANSSRIEVHLNMDEELVYLSVVDYGDGFDPQCSPMGMGISNMRTRLSIFGGRIDIHSELEKGTEVNVELGIKGDVV